MILVDAIITIIRMCDNICSICDEESFAIFVNYGSDNFRYLWNVYLLHLSITCELWSSRCIVQDAIFTAVNHVASKGLKGTFQCCDWQILFHFACSCF